MKGRKHRPVINPGKISFPGKISTQGIVKLLCLLPLVFSFSCGRPSGQDKAAVTFRAAPRTLSLDSAIYISGSSKNLGEWQIQNAVKLRRQKNNVWSETLLFEKGSRIEYKFTQGSWESEALAEDGTIPPNSSAVIKGDTVITVHIPGWSSDKRVNLYTMDRNAFSNPEGRFPLPDYCKYQAGDDIKWASPAYSDSSWQTARMNTTPWLSDYPQWRGMGWFRIHLNVDSIHFNRPVALMIDQLGATEFYINGKLAASFGKMPIKPDDREVITAVYSPFIIKLGSTKDQIIAIRYFNSSALYYRQFNFFTGLSVQFMEPQKAIAWHSERTNSLLNTRMLFAAIPLVLALIHFFIYVFFPDDRADLFYSICLFSFSIMTVSDIQRQLTEMPSQILLLTRIYSAVIPAITFFGLLAAYTSFSGRLPRRHIAYSVIMVILLVWGLLMPGRLLSIPQYGFISLCVLELIWIMFTSDMKKDKARWLPSSGFGILAAVVAYNILIDFGFFDPFTGINISISYGFLCLMVAMSVYQSLGSARTSRSLKEKLAEVQDLSEKMLQQEKTQHESEMERRLLEADNLRKTRELEEARSLQLSMLPKDIPSVEGMKISVYMQTASEVGGDYYDFHLAEDNTLTVAIGDATGHGTKAGTMVTITKSLFNEVASSDSPLDILRKFSSAIRRISLPRLYMSLSILKMKGSDVRLASAGMPPVFIFRAEEKRTEILIIKSMPLGSFASFPYSEMEFQLKTGDVMLLLTDGFIELFNEKRDTPDIEGTEKLFGEFCRQDPDRIIEQLCCWAENWRGNEPQHDDMTFIVINK